MKFVIGWMLAGGFFACLVFMAIAPVIEEMNRKHALRERQAELDRQRLREARAPLRQAIEERMQARDKAALESAHNRLTQSLEKTREARDE